MLDGSCGRLVVLGLTGRLAVRGRLAVLRGRVAVLRGHVGVLSLPFAVRAVLWGVLGVTPWVVLPVVRLEELDVERGQQRRSGRGCDGRE